MEKSKIQPRSFHLTSPLAAHQVCGKMASPRSREVEMAVWHQTS